MTSIRIHVLLLGSAVVLTGSLVGCAGFQAAMAAPNSRGMTLNTLNAQVQPGLTMQEVTQRIGMPAYTFRVGWQRLDVWNYRFARPEGDCTVFQISFAQATGKVTETGQGPDPACDGPNRD